MVADGRRRRQRSRRPFDSIETCSSFSAHWVRATSRGSTTPCARLSDAISQAMRAGVGCADTARRRIFGFRAYTESAGIPTDWRQHRAVRSSYLFRMAATATVVPGLILRCQKNIARHKRHRSAESLRCPIGPHLPILTVAPTRFGAKYPPPATWGYRLGYCCNWRCKKSNRFRCLGPWFDSTRAYSEERPRSNP